MYDLSTYSKSTSSANSESAGQCERSVISPWCVTRDSMPQRDSALSENTVNFGQCFVSMVIASSPNAISHGASNMNSCMLGRASRDWNGERVTS